MRSGTVCALDGSKMSTMVNSDIKSTGRSTLCAQAKDCRALPLRLALLSVLNFAGLHFVDNLLNCV